MSRLGLELLASLERKFAESKALHLQGTARVRLSQLFFLDPIRPIDKKVTNSLKRAFAAEGCLQHEVDYSVPAILDNISLQRALTSLMVTSESFKSTLTTKPPVFELPTGIQLQCLHGQHRIHAAEEYLPPGDRWWLVDIYSEDLDNDTRKVLREGHSYSTNYSDGELFRQIRVCQFNGDRVSEDRWRVQLGKNKEQDLNKLLKRGLLINALDSVLPIRGLWGSFHLGSMDIFLSIKCDEEIACYIKLIQKTWSFIIGDHESRFQYIDEQTVKLVELRAPGVSKLDSEFLRKEMLLKNVFSGVQEPAIRTEIEQRLRSVEYLIPSLKSLFKDLRYLEPAAKAIKALLPKSSKGTLRHNLRYLLTRIVDNSLAVQESEIHYSTVVGSFDDLFDLAVREMFLCAMRYFAYPANISTKRDMDPIKQTLNGPKRYLGYKLLELGHRLGFELSVGIDIHKDPADRLLEDLLQSLPKEIFKLDFQVPLYLSLSFKNYLLNSTISTASSSQPSITTIGIGEPLSRRCGRGGGGPPSDNDRPHLFLRKMHAPLSQIQKAGFDISSFYVKRCTYLAFFGAIQIPSAVEPLGQEAVRANGTQFGGTNNVQFGGTNNVDGQTTDPNEMPQRSPSTVIPLNQDQEQATLSAEVCFISQKADLISARVAFSREAVEEQAKVYAERGFSLMDTRGHHWIWNQCYSALINSGTNTIIVVIPARDVVEVAHKRRGAVTLGDRGHENELVHKTVGQNQAVPTGPYAEEREEL